MQAKKNILLVDDHKIVRDGIREILERKGEYQVHDSASGRNALHLLGKNKIDLVISDINMDGMDGIELCAEIKKNWPDMKILVLTMNKDSALIQKMLELGASGYLLKESGKEEILAGINAIFNEECFLSREVILSMTRQLSKNKQHLANQINLTDREKEILILIAKEFTNKEIGGTLFISHRTVDTHRRNIIEKIGAKNTAGIVKYAIDNDLI